MSHNPYFSRWFSAIYSPFTLIIRISTVTILILVDGFLQYIKLTGCFKASSVTILILVDGFLQCYNLLKTTDFINSHNPYFSRWFSAINTIYRHI